MPVEVTDQFVQIPARAVDLFSRLRTMDLDTSQGIKLVFGELKSTGKTAPQTYLFPPNKGWTTAKAEKWVADNRKKHETASWGRNRSGFEGDKDLVVGVRKANGAVQLMLTARTSDEVEFDEWALEHLQAADKGKIVLNRAGVAHARALIKAGRYTSDRAWAASAGQMKKLLGSPANWTRYGAYHLGVNKGAKVGTRNRFKFPFGTGGDVSRRALAAAAQRASQFGYESIQQAASALVALIKAKEGTAQARADFSGIVGDNGLLLLRFEEFCAAGDIFAEGSHVELDAEGVPTAFRIREWGQWPTTKYGTLTVDKSSAKSVMAWFRKRGLRCVIDWEHQTYNTETNGQPAPAVGYFDIEVRDDGLWTLNLEWLKQGRQFMKDKSYRYFSPTGQFDPKTKRLETIDTIGLTNVPATNQQLPLVATHGAPTPPLEEEPMENLWTKLGLSPEADEDAAIAKVDELLKAKDDEHTTALADLKAKADEDPEKVQLKKVMEQVLELLNLKADATEPEVKAALATLKAKAPEADKVAELQKTVLALTTSVEGTRVQDALRKFEAKITPANKDIAAEMARDLPADKFEANMKQWPDVRGPAPNTPAAGEPSSDELMSKGEMDVFENMAKAKGWTGEEKAKELKLLKDHKIKMNARA